MRESLRLDPFIKKFLNRLPTEVADAFTDTQLDAIKQAFELRSGTYTVDIRTSIPLPGRPFYLVVLAGPECRPKQRLKAEQQKFPLFTPGNCIALAVLSVLSATTVLGMLYGFQKIPVPTFLPTVTKPTDIPWLTDKDSCENSGRTWRDSKCADHGHSYLF